MNKHILLIMDHHLNPGKYSKEQLINNAIAAFEVAQAECGASRISISLDAASSAAHDTALNAVHCVSKNGHLTSDYFLKRYFKEAGESKQDYIDEINKEDKK